MHQSQDEGPSTIVENRERERERFNLFFDQVKKGIQLGQILNKRFLRRLD